MKANSIKVDQSYNLENKHKLGRYYNFCLYQIFEQTSNLQMR
jgi:hypothetical protein